MAYGLDARANSSTVQISLQNETRDQPRRQGTIQLRALLNICWLFTARVVLRLHCLHFHGSREVLCTRARHSQLDWLTCIQSSSVRRCRVVRWTSCQMGRRNERSGYQTSTLDTCRRWCRSIRHIVGQIRWRKTESHVNSIAQPHCFKQVGWVRGIK